MGLLITFSVLNSMVTLLFCLWERDTSKMADFSSLGLSDWLINQCKQLGIHKATPVQENCVPAILQGKLASWLAHVNVIKQLCHINILWLIFSTFIKKLCSTVAPRVTTCRYVLFIGRDCMGCAKTGSGKTAAFVLPVLQKLSEDPYGIYCLVLTPTRSVLFKVEPGRTQLKCGGH